MMHNEMVDVDSCVLYAKYYQYSLSGTSHVREFDELGGKCCIKEGINCNISIL